MADIGAKVSQKGFSVETAADYQLLFSSSWPLLKIQHQGTFSGNAATDFTIDTHGLSYVPAFWVFTVGDFPPGDGTYAAGQSRIEGSAYFAVNGTDLKYLGASRGGGSYVGTVSGYYYIFRQDLASTLLPTSTITTPAAPISVGDYGLKVSKIGKSITSTDLRDYALNSSTRSPNLHLTGHTTVTPFTITHNLGYPPMFFIYGLITSWGDGRYQQIATSAGSRVSATNTTITFATLDGAGTFAYIIFKDPVLLNS